MTHKRSQFPSQSLGLVVSTGQTQQQQRMHKKWQKHIKSKPKATANSSNYSLRVCISLCTIVVCNTAQNSFFFPLDNHHCSDVVYCKGWTEST